MPDYFDDLLEEKFGGFIDLSDWVYAKSYPNHPHEYTIRRKTISEKTFREFVQTIKTSGLKEMFYKVEYKCLFIGDYKYWVQPYDTVDNAQVINRSKQK